MSPKKIIAVVGATGAQGGGLVRAILADPSGDWAVRAITRDVTSDKAKALAALGAEVVAADVDNEESLTSALQGAYGAFFVTFFWDHFSPDKEKQSARNMANAAKAAGVHHVIWSSLEDTRKWIPLSDDRMPTLQEHYKVPHFDAKGEANAYFAEAGVPTTILNTSFYWENFIYFGAGPARGADGVLALTMPMADKKLPGIAVKDIGKTAFNIFKDPSYIGKTVSIAGEHLTGEEMAKGLSTALGENVVYNDVPASVYRSFGFPGADDMGNMYQFKAEFNEDFVGARNLNVVRAINPELQSFSAWLDENKSLIPLG
ncbi:MAG: NmrA/HSCARG family protein [Candidatus Kapabacteria bacterium]|nr:NmrA/HSCARG family protein [Candidatus Kapabacteria bacterium]